MPAGTYTVRVYVNGYPVPYYQYINQAAAVVTVDPMYTPVISEITPDTQLPGSLVTISGDFKVK